MAASVRSDTCNIISWFLGYVATNRHKKRWEMTAIKCVIPSCWQSQKNLFEKFYCFYTWGAACLKKTTLQSYMHIRIIVYGSRTFVYRRANNAAYSVIKNGALCTSKNERARCTFFLKKKTLLWKIDTIYARVAATGILTGNTAERLCTQLMLGVCREKHTMCSNWWIVESQFISIHFWPKKCTQLKLNS